MRLTKPSFKLKNSDYVVFSPSGKLLAQKGQSGTKISIWDIEKCSLVAQHKVISNEDTIGFLADDKKMFVKNKNGDLAFFETYSGDIISSSGKNHLYNSGSNPVFSEKQKLLYDGSWNGEICAWEINPIDKIKSHIFDGQMITFIRSDLEQKNFYAVLQCKDTHYVSLGTRILNFSDIEGNFKQTWINPTAVELTENGFWKPISAIELGSQLVLGLQLNGVVEPPMIACVALDSNQTTFKYLDSKYQTIWSITSNNSVIISAVSTSTYRPGMTGQEQMKANEGVEKSHIYIHDKKTLGFVDKIFWPDVMDVSLDHQGQGLAIASYKKSAYISDYRKLSDNL